MEQIKWYQSTTLRALLVAFVSQLIVWFGLTEQLPEGTAVLAVDGLLQLLAIGATAYAAYARANRANPPITATAARKQGELNTTPPPAQGDTPPMDAGFARPALLALLIALAAPAFVIVGGCEAVGVTQPATVEQRLAYAYGTHTAILDAAASAVETGRMTAEEGEHVLKFADDARAVLDASRISFAAGDITNANERLQLALTILTELQTYLNRRAPQ